MELTAELKQKAIARVRHFIDLANQKYPGLNMSMPIINFDLRGRTAGTANSSTHTIRLNAGLFVRNVEDYMNDTIPHEVAHLVQYKLHPTQRRWTGRKWVRTVQPHGYEWQRVMRSFGVAPERCHQMDTSETRVKKNVTKYQYKCNCKTHEVGKKVHNRIQMGHTYTCRSCKGTLTTGSFVAVKHPKPAAVKPVETATKLPRGGTKKEQAEHWFLHYRNHTNAREMCISVYMNELGMSKAGASTYFSNAKKKFA